jgi:hypothetical protein
MLIAFLGLCGSVAAMSIISMPETINFVLTVAMFGFLLVLIKLAVTPPRILAQSADKLD